MLVTMALRNYKCAQCKSIELYFDHEQRVCQCGSEKLERQMSIPLKATNTDRTDTFRNVDTPVGMQEDIKSRTIQHNLDNLDDMIAEWGEKHAKEQGWLVYDITLKKWRKNDKWDKDLLNKGNSGSQEHLTKVTKK